MFSKVYRKNWFRVQIQSKMFVRLLRSFPKMVVFGFSSGRWYHWFLRWGSNAGPFPPFFPKIRVWNILYNKKDTMILKSNDNTPMKKRKSLWKLTCLTYMPLKNRGGSFLPEIYLKWISSAGFVGTFFYLSAHSLANKWLGLWKSSKARKSSKESAWNRTYEFRWFRCQWSIC